MSYGPRTVRYEKEIAHRKNVMKIIKDGELKKALKEYNESKHQSRKTRKAASSTSIILSIAREDEARRNRLAKKMYRLQCKIAEDIYAMRLMSIGTEEMYKRTGCVLKQNYDQFYPEMIDPNDCSSTDSLPSDDEPPPSQIRKAFIREDKDVEVRSTNNWMWITNIWHENVINLQWTYDHEDDLSAENHKITEDAFDLHEQMMEAIYWARLNKENWCDTCGYDCDNTCGNTD
jgi:hypothetical protein